MMTLTQIQQRIHQLYEGSTDYPDSDSDDYALRLGLINQAEQVWETEEVDWRELHGTASTTTDGTSQIDAETDFIQPLGQLVITESTGDVYYPFKRTRDAQRILANNSSEKFYYVTGTPGAYKINVNPTPSTGLTVTYPYKKSVTQVSSGSDIPQMSRPLYVVYYVLSKLYELDGRNDMLTSYNNQAYDVMANMKIINEEMPAGHIDVLEDPGYELNGEAFGV